MQREENIHPLRLTNYLPIARFFAHTGFRPLPGMTTEFSCLETDGVMRAHPMNFWINEDVGMAWQLWRQDDNGNRFLVDTFATKELAEERILALTRSHHKQTYWVSEEE